MATSPSEVCEVGVQRDDALALQRGFAGRFGPVAERAAGAACAAAGEARVWHEGEIHNAAEIARELGLDGAEPLAQLLRAGWRRWGEGLWRRLDGVFAAVIEDGERLLLYRDPSGLQSLYLDAGRGDGSAAFATDLDRLLRLPGARRRICRAALHEYLRLGDIAAPRTVFEGVVAVQPGWQLSWSARGIDARPAPQQTDGGAAPPADFEAAVERVEALLDAAVRGRLEGAAHPAAFLSGGVDSALLCALGRRQRADLTALTVGFDGAAYDESPAARRIAQHLGLRHRVLRFGRDDCLGALERLYGAADQPFADPAAASTLLAFEHCRGRFDAVLDGSGADEAVGMMPPRHVRVAVGHASRLPRPLRALLAALVGAWPRLAPYRRVLDFEHPAETVIRWRGFGRAEIESLCGEPVSFADTHFFRTFATFPRHAHFERYSALLDAMPLDRLNQAMQASGQRARFPYAARDVDRCLRGLPLDHRWLPAQPKRILRAVLARHVPAPLWEAPKHGFDFPLQAFLAADDHALVRPLLAGADAGILGGLVSPDGVRRLAQRFVAGEAHLAFRVWLLVLLALWLQHHGEART